MDSTRASGHSASDVDAVFVDLVGRSGVSPEWALGASALLAQLDGPDGTWPTVEPALRTAVRSQVRR